MRRPELEEEPSEPVPVGAQAPLPYEIAGSMIGILQATGGTDDDAAFATGRLELELSAGCGEHATLFAAIEAINGDGPSALYGNLSEVNANAGSTQCAADGADRLTFREAFAEFALPGVTLTVGRLDGAAFIDASEFANDEREQFLAAAFVNNAAVILPREEFTPGFAAVFEMGPATLSLVGLSDDNLGEMLFRNMVGIAELAVAYGQEGAAGNVRVHCSLDGAGLDADGKAASDQGLGVSFDQELGTTLAMFARFCRRDVDAVDAEVERSWSAGLVLRSFWSTREEDVLGLAYGEIAVPDNDTTEKLVEAYYRAVLEDQLAVSIHLQSIRDPECDPDADPFAVIGVRTQLTF
jgi:hypothetical protein